MDIALARTFLMVAETGSFIDAARKMNITQSTVSARIKGLEDLFGRPLFERSKNGAALTGAGEQFQKHALALVRVWQHAQLEVGLSGHLPRPSGRRRAGHAVGRVPAASGSPGCATTSPTSPSRPAPACPAVMIQRLLEGTLDLAVMYRPGQPPGLTIEHLFDEEFVLVTSAPAAAGTSSDYVFVDWGPDFQAEHAAAYPELDQHRRQPRSGLAGARLPAGQRGVRLLPAAAGQAPRHPPPPAHPGAGAHVHLPRLHGLSRGPRRGGLRADPGGPAAGVAAADLIDSLQPVGWVERLR